MVGIVTDVGINTAELLANGRIIRLDRERLSGIVLTKELLDKIAKRTPTLRQEHGWIDYEIDMLHFRFNRFKHYFVLPGDEREYEFLHILQVCYKEAYKGSKQLDVTPIIDSWPESVG